MKGVWRFCQNRIMLLIVDLGHMKVKVGGGLEDDMSLTCGGKVSSLIGHEAPRGAQSWPSIIFLFRVGVFEPRPLEWMVVIVSRLLL